MEDKKKNETRQSTMQNRMENMNGQKPKTISIVISVYNEEKALHEFYREATPVFEALPWNYELIFVNDGSADASGQILAELAAADPRVRVINFSRNFGQEAAMLAGLVQAPSRLAPTKHYDRAAKRMKMVVGSMVAAGYITQAEAARMRPW